MQKLTTLALIAALAAPAAALANDFESEHATNREVLSQADPAARELFLRPVTLKQGRNHTLPVTLRAGKFYTFFGDCDDSCNNMDMNLMAANGARVAGDNLPDNQPLFTFQAPSSGNYRIVFRGLYGVSADKANSGLSKKISDAEFGTLVKDEDLDNEHLMKWNGTLGQKYRHINTDYVYTTVLVDDYAIWSNNYQTNKYKLCPNRTTTDARCFGIRQL